MGRLKALLHAQQPDATTQRNTQQPDVLHVASPRACNTQQQPISLSKPGARPLRAVAKDVASAELQSAYACDRCRNRDMQQGPMHNGRRGYVWVCLKGHRILRTGLGAEDVLLAPPDCTDYDNTPLTGPGVFH